MFAETFEPLFVICLKGFKPATNRDFFQARFLFDRRLPPRCSACPAPLIGQLFEYELPRDGHETNPAVQNRHMTTGRAILESVAITPTHQRSLIPSKLSRGFCSWQTMT